MSIELFRKEILQDKSTFFEVKRTIKTMCDFERDNNKEIINLLQILKQQKLSETLKNISLEQVAKTGSGIKVNLLNQHGINNVCDLRNISDYALASIPGIGAITVERIRKTVNNIYNNAARTNSIKFSIKQRSYLEGLILEYYYVLINSKDIIIRAQKFYNEYIKPNEDHAQSVAEINNKIVWYFRNTKSKQRIIENAKEFDNIVKGEGFKAIYDIFDDYLMIMKNSNVKNWEDFINNSAKYYAEISKNIDCKIEADDYYAHGISKSTFEMINQQNVDLSLFKSTLRGYQLFGVKYILHQSATLLGDEMGLGKTVQAIAAMCDIQSSGGKYFLVVCPASVIINWTREVKLHSKLEVFKLHGSYAQEKRRWFENGGVAVTTFETLKNIKFQDTFKLDMIVVDEAHYIKNPKAQRTQAIMQALKNSKRKLLMTGTPLENRIDEMIMLISYLDTYLAKQISEIQYLSNADQYQQKIAKVYLRRLREDVIGELPELIINEEWCSISHDEHLAYTESVKSGNFMAMRQVSYNISDLDNSTKIRRIQELCEQAAEENDKVIIFSFFRNTISKLQKIFGDNTFEPITGSTDSTKRQKIVDEFSNSKSKHILICQVQAGGVGLNIQKANVVIFCEPQIKPSIENQAISRAYRFGQLKNVLVYRLLCQETVDERVNEIIKNKQEIFDTYAENSVMANESNKSIILTSSIIKDEKARLSLN